MGALANPGLALRGLDGSRSAALLEGDSTTAARVAQRASSYFPTPRNPRRYAPRVSADVAARAEPLAIARTGDKVGGHGRAALGALIGAGVGIGAVILSGVTIGAAGIATVFSGGLGAPLMIGAVLGATAMVTGGLAVGARIGKKFGSAPCSECQAGSGALGPGRPVFVENQRVVRLGLDWCGHGAKPKLKSGCRDVYVNGRPLGRVSDAFECGGKILTGAQRTLAAGATTGDATDPEDASIDTIGLLATGIGLLSSAIMVGPLLATRGLAGSLATMTPKLLVSIGLGRTMHTVGRAIDAERGTPGVFEPALEYLASIASGFINVGKIASSVGKLGAGLGSKLRAPGVYDEVLDASDPRGANAKWLNPAPRLRGPREEPPPQTEPAKPPEPPGRPSGSSGFSAKATHAFEEPSGGCTTCSKTSEPAGGAHTAAMAQAGGFRSLPAP